MNIAKNNLTIRNAESSDAEQLCLWWNDGKVMAHAGFPNGLNTTADEIRKDLASDNDDTHRRHIIEHNGKPIGEMNYRNRGGNIAEIGIKICDFSKQEKGLGTTLLTMFINALFTQYGYDKIVLDTNAKNKRAQHVYEKKLGFKVVRVRNDSWRDQLGELQSSIDYELTKEEWFRGNTNLFTGKAEAYADARPGYPEAAMDYIRNLIPPKAVFADIGAGTGKFTYLIARSGYTVYAVEPNADMREQLAGVLSPFENAKIINGTAEATTISNKIADVITCAQALHWFDPDKFREECRRIGKPGVIVIAVYNNTPGGSGVMHSKQSTDVFFKNPVVADFPNPQYYTRENWLKYMTSHSRDPLPSDARYDAHMAEMNEIFDRENVEGLLCREVVTKVYFERL
jgi:RimJ/RimL family protein N-acetyltransferase/ubiquinone/menaquinone biosynthesis C-methylase UbiE